MKRMFFLPVTMFFVLPAAFADSPYTGVTRSVYVDNPDFKTIYIDFTDTDLKMHYDNQLPDDTLPTKPGGVIERYYDLKRDGFNLPVRFLVDQPGTRYPYPGMILNENLPDGSQCNYALLTTEVNGFIIRGNGGKGQDGCFYKKDRYTPVKSPVLTITNNSSEMLHVDFFVNGGSRIQTGFLEEGAVRIYTGDSGYLKENDVEYGSEIKLRLFGAGINSPVDTIDCPTISSFMENIDYQITPEYKCEITPQLKSGVTIKEGSTSFLTVDQANDEGFKILYKTPDGQDEENYFLVVIKEDEPKIGNYFEVKPGIEAEHRAKVIKKWHPDGGTFIVGISKSSFPGSVKFIGETIKVRTVNW